ncbi:hypothetical protein [Flagellimonas sp.]|uniref:hypothetical protein n=1 Tax=Flagellimonas sp. TaxID=2058762 RepID=UPI003B5072AE
MTQLALYNNVKTNLILCDNFEFVIRVDQLVNDSLRYLCWKKPKSITEIPDLIIENGIALEKTKTDRQEYVFSNGEWNYALEKIVVGEVSDIVHIFFEISDKDGKENYAWKMRDLTRSTYANIR